MMMSFPSEIDYDERLRFGAIQFWHRVKIRGADNGELWGVLLQLRLILDLHRTGCGQRGFARPGW